MATLDAYNRLYDISPGTLVVGQTYCSGPIYVRGAQAVQFRFRCTGTPVASQSVAFNVRAGIFTPASPPAARFPSDGLVESGSTLYSYTTTGLGTWTTATSPALAANADLLYTVTPTPATLPGLMFDWIAIRIPSITTANLTGVTIQALVINGPGAPVSDTTLFTTYNQ